jgi:hypothetical protein
MYAIVVGHYHVIHVDGVVGAHVVIGIKLVAAGVLDQLVGAVAQQFLV